MIFFKKKLTELEAPEVLAEIVKVILNNTVLDPLSIIKQVIPVPLPPLPSPPGREYFSNIIAKAIVAGIPREKALEIIREIRNQLKDYKV
ncbi:hypothetical protein DRO31_06070 [Candidatus Bathyarchaeota archaeon]|nr:MAG: hypothetical protein DRO31_06070 [Candidatus Bathyarchaeota archaeon]